MSKNFLTYGLKDQKLIHINKVYPGLSCNCFCPNCGHPLVSKNSEGNIKVPHFAHYKGQECAGAYESALHLLAKKVFSENKIIMLPDYHHDYNMDNQLSLHREGKTYAFDVVELEKRIEFGSRHIIADAIAYKGGSQVLVEFANTHFAEQEKLDLLIVNKLACFEVDISGCELDEEKMRAFLTTSKTNRHWIINPRLDEDYLQKTKEEEEAALEKIKQNLEKAKEDGYSIHAMKGDFAEGCVKPVPRISDLKMTDFYQHPKLKRIIDGEYWNGKISGSRLYGKYIYINGHKNEVYPNSIDYRSSDNEKNSEFLYKGLKTIQEIKNREGKNLPCFLCRSALKQYEINGQKMQICAYPKRVT